MEIIIKKYNNSYKEELRELIIQANGELNLLNLVEGNRSTSKGSFIALQKEKMIGLITSWKSIFHPYCTYFRCIALPEYLDCLDRLLAEMEGSLSKGDYPLQISLDENSILGNYFSRLNFKIIRKTYLPSLDLSVSLQGMLPVALQQIKSLREIETRPDIITQLTKLVKRNYEETHLVNPVADLTLDKWKEMIWAEDILLDGSYVYLNEKGDGILAYSFLHKSDQQGTVELGWSGASDLSEIDILSILLEKQIYYSQLHGYRFLEGEFDTTSPYAMHMLKSKPFPREPVLITFQKEKEND
ncbi:GNAT family acetyltransferase [Ornithinibacillus bavariensis]|uniref:GNAT family acetyltransferase n=1 Tax=Ornithinibacillus bavariensis TaxID=545502 RepID=UPI000EDC615B|nr:GNAT family acetyltransferase [Ornithinibacillus sp.]